MKTICLLTAAAAFCTIKALALPVGNPSEPSLFLAEDRCEVIECPSDNPCFKGMNFRIGYYGDFVFNRHLETVKDKDIDYTHITTNAGYFAFTCWELCELFATLGASKFSFNTSLSHFALDNPGPRFDFETSTAFSWSLGARGILWEYKCFSLGVMGQYFTSKPHTKVWYIRTNTSANQNSLSSRYSEWQAGAGLSYRYSYYFVPYIALKWSRALWEFNDQGLFLTNGGTPVATMVNLQSAKHWGGAVGLSFAPFRCKNLAVTVEGRFGDETAVHVNGHLCF